MGYRFTLVLNREITDDESESLLKAGCAEAAITTTTHPTNADSLVTQLDIDTEAATSLAEAIQAALDAVTTVPDLSAPSLTVPPQSHGSSGQDEAASAGPADAAGPAALEAGSNAAPAQDVATKAEDTAGSDAPAEPEK
ncbi:hypothetical protein A6P39_006285 [Streptomyces sp. FXJ1.172]|uniref:hypothetical protein n=1 Tax=Streptomyces sp. FXJ1.172 TaxID=710705 RepID=UPI0007D03925|nr:hypothetical protein [Streptomyces sp. FXJ1.172]WEO93654.1 hypothetical protein A6P39_006285 [Streptomyces sp. FXJ1.172]